MFQKTVMALSLPALLATSGDSRRIDRPHPADRDRPAYLALAPIEVPIFDNGRIEGRVFVKLVIEGQDGLAVNALSDDMPNVRARLLTALIEFNRLNVSGLSPIDAERLSRVLNSRATIADGAVRRVLITELSSIPL